MPIDIETLLTLPPEERIRLAVALWQSVAQGQAPAAMPLPPEQQAELERRLAEYPEDDVPGQPVPEVMARLHATLWPER